MKRSSSPLGYSVRERTDPGRPKRWLVAFAPDWKEKTAPKELRTRAQIAAWAEARIAAGTVLPKPPAPPRPAGPTVRELYEAWLPLVTKRPDIESATVEGYRSAFVSVLLPLRVEEEGAPPRTLGEEPAASLDVPRLRDIVRRLREVKARVGLRGKPAKEALRERPLSPSRIGNVFSALSVWLSDMVADRKVPLAVNPALDPAVRRELPERPRPQRTRLDGEAPGVALLEDVAAVIASDAVAVELRVRTVLVHTSALRDGELAGLRVKAVHRNVPTPCIGIHEAVKMHGPKGRATPGKLKSTSSDRVVPLHPAALAAINEWLDVHWPRIVGRAPRPDDFVFARPDGRPYRPRSAEMWRGALVAAGRPAKRGGRACTWHAARHTFSSALAAADVPNEMRSLLLGHAAEDVTEAHYTGRHLADLAKAVSVLPLVWPDSASVRPIARPLAESRAGTHGNDWSHLRDLNSRPTVYETADLSATTGLPHRGVGLSKGGAGRKSNGTKAATVPRDGSARPVGRVLPGIPSCASVLRTKAPFSATMLSKVGCDSPFPISRSWSARARGRRANR